MKKFRGMPFADWFLNHQSELTTPSSLNWFFLKQVDHYLFFLNNPLSLRNSEEFSPDVEVVFEKWNQSEFADIFLKLLNTGKHVPQASQTTFRIFEKHLIGLGQRHILKTKGHDSFYRYQPSLGEVKKGKIVSRLLETTLKLKGKELNLKTSSLKEMKEFSHKIEIALKIINKFSPSSYERFDAFTETIIPINQEELVSYSHQDLPGTSMINMYHRSFVDLIDDLIHENGHHHLNYFLNLQSLIKEPLDNIYYSPWRSTLRPLRGVFHAYFTFFWAFKLFSDIASAKEMDSIYYLFSSKEKETIYFRAIEEFYMLNFTYQDLKWARKRKLIYDTGWNLISEQQRHLSKFKSKIKIWEKKLKLTRKEITALKKNLKSAEVKYFKA